MTSDLQDTVALLARTPAVLDSLLRDLPDTWTRRNEGDGTWNAFEIVGHLIHAERADWMPRVRMVLQSGESQAFEPFDRAGAEREDQRSSLAQRLDEFARLRTALRVRGFRNRADLHSYRTIGQVAGTLLVRSHERSERVGQAMRCRGFDGQFRSLTQFHTAARDVLLFLIITLPTIVLVTVDGCYR